MATKTVLTAERKAELLKIFDAKAKEYFIKTCKAAGVQSLSTCGIDLTNSGELFKLAVRLKTATAKVS